MLHARCTEREFSFLCICWIFQGDCAVRAVAGVRFQSQACMIRSSRGMRERRRGNAFPRLLLSLVPFVCLLPSQHLPCCGRRGIHGRGVTSRRPLRAWGWSGPKADVWIVTRKSGATSVRSDMAHLRSGGWKEGAGVWIMPSSLLWRILI